MATKTLCDTDSTQILTNKTLTAPTITSGTISLAAAPSATLDAATKGYVDGLNINPLNNGSLAASVNSNILTLSLKTAGGSTPSSSDPVRITFTTSADTDGSLVTRTVTSSTSMTFASGSSLGMTNGVAARLWVGLLDNSGTVELCAWNPYNTSSQASIKAFAPNADVSTTAEGSGTATSAHVLYSTNARTNLPFVLLGFIEISEATAGVWASAPTVVQTFRDGSRKTGDVVQTCLNITGASATGTTLIPADDTIPQNTEGDQFMSQAITPLSAMNVLHIEHNGAYSYGGTATGQITAALFQDSTANALAVQRAGRDSVSTSPSQVTLIYFMRAGTTSSTTFKIRAGQSSAGTTTFNGSGGARDYGGSFSSILLVREIYV